MDRRTMLSRLLAAGAVAAGAQVLVLDAAAGSWQVDTELSGLTPHNSAWLYRGTPAPARPR
jgi:hypothetical protein